MSRLNVFSVPTAPDAAFWTANCDPVPPSLGVPIGDPRHHLYRP